MSLGMLKQNSEILLEVAQNYENLLLKRRSATRKEDINIIEAQIKNFRNQFIYLLAAIDRLVKEEKNAR